MMPNTIVKTAASTNSSRPNCRPFSDCSTRTNPDPSQIVISTPTPCVRREGKPVSLSDRAPQRETKQRQRVGAAAYFYWRVIICQTAYTSTPPKQAIGSLKLL